MTASTQSAVVGQVYPRPQRRRLPSGHPPDGDGANGELPLRVAPAVSPRQRLNHRRVGGRRRGHVGA